MRTEKSNRAFAEGVPERGVLPAGSLAAFDTRQASLYTGLAESTLEKKRVAGDGPRFVRYSRKAVRYLVADLDAWMAERTVSSTSERLVGR